MKRRTLLFPLALMGSLFGCGGSGLGEPAGIQNQIGRASCRERVSSPV